MIRTSELENLKLASGRVTRSTPERILSSNSHLERNAIGNGCYLELFREFHIKNSIEILYSNINNNNYFQPLQRSRVIDEVKFIVFNGPSPWPRPGIRRCLRSHM